jgi:branched-subunit amino acid ABC-type transport system permease component
MVGTLAVGVLLLTYAVRRYTVTPRYTLPLISGDGFRVAGVFVSRQQVLTLAIALLVLLVLWLVNRFTSFGLRLRATALDSYAAGLIGVNNNLVSLVTWVVAGALAGLSAILIAPTVSMDVFFMTQLLFWSLAAALIGGLTSTGGAFVAGIVLGIAEAVIRYESPEIGIDVGLEQAVLAVFIIVMLLVRPSGLVRSRY